jgi:hypothetical protein
MFQIITNDDPNIGALIECASDAGARKPCRKCGGFLFRVEEGRGPHAYRIRCVEHWNESRWLPKADAETAFSRGLNSGDFKEASVKGKTMAIGFSLEEKKGGNFLPVLKFDAKAGDFMAVNREPQSDGTWEKSEVEIEKPFKFVADMENLQVGWMSFKPGAVSFELAKIGERMPDRPTPDHKQGIRVRLFMKDHGLREFSHTSKNVLRAFDALHDEYVAKADSHKGKMPVVEVTGTDTVKMQTKEQGELRFKVPKWSITGWVDPPAAFAGAQEAAPQPAPKKAMPAAKAVDDDAEF